MRDIEIISAYIDKRNQEVILEAVDISDEQFRRQSRERFEEARELTFVFNALNPRDMGYLKKFLKHQKRVRELLKAGQATWGQVLQAVVGIRTVISGRYIRYPY